MAIYLCRYCRLPSDASGLSCPNCGAPVDVTAVSSHSGWVELPAIKDMARIQVGRSSVQIEGVYVPVADFRLDPDDWIFFSHHVLLWAEPTVRMDTMPMAGGWNRKLAGLPLVMMRAAGPGHLALSADAPGEVVAVPLPAGGQVIVREHAFLAATGSVDYSWERSGVWYVTGSGDDRETHYPMGWVVDRFSARAPGLLLLHAPGNTFLRDLAPGETICVQPGALLSKDPSVGMALHLEYPASAGMTFSRSYSMRNVWLRLWGPGRVAINSVFARGETGGYIASSSPATVQRW
jgi:uncharacterized protein (AIM24 family)